MNHICCLTLLLAIGYSVNSAPKHTKPDFYHDLEGLDREQKRDKIDTIINEPLPGGNTSCDEFYTIRHWWSGGAIGKMNFDVPQTVNKWKITVQLENGPGRFYLQRTRRVGRVRKGCKFTFTNMRNNKAIKANQTFANAFNILTTTKVKIGYIKFESGAFSMSCGSPAACPTLPPGVTLPPLEGGCSNFTLVRQSRPGYERGIVRFSLPGALKRWRLKIGFNEAVQNFQVQRHANMMGIMRLCPKTTFYNYVKAYNQRDQAGKAMAFPYVFRYNQRQNGTKPMINFLKISDEKNTFMCGTKPTCPATTPAPTTTTGNYTGTLTNATTTTSTIEMPLFPLGGAECSTFLKNVQQGFQDQQGNLEFLVSRESKNWQVKIGFSPDTLPTNFNVFDRALRVQSPDECLYKYQNRPEDRYDANTTFSKQYRFEYSRENGQPEVQYISFSSGNFTMSCGTNDCSVINITTPRPTPSPTPRNTTTSPLVTSPPLGGDSCDVYIDITRQSAGQKFGIIRITTTTASSGFKIIIGFNASTTGFNIERGVNRIDSQERCPGFIYVFESIRDGNFAAGSTFVYPFSLNFEQTAGVNPMIAYIKFAYSVNETESCGEEPVCPTTTIKTTTTTTTTQEPEVTTREPELSTQEPEVSTWEPEVSTQEPEVSTREPEVSTQEPEVTTQEPDVSTQEPVASTEKPEVSTQEPEVTTREPEVSSQEPEASTQEPEVTTQEPEVSTQEPVASTEKPEVSTQEPEVTTREPEVSTQEPEVSTQELEVSTQEPEVSTQEPEVSTREPEVSNKEPEVSNKEPESSGESSI